MDRAARSLALTFALAVTAGSPQAAAQDENNPPPSPGLSVGSSGEWAVFDAILPGPLLDAVAGRSGQGSLWALTAPDEASGESTLFQIVATGDGRLIRDPRPVPSGTDALDLADVDGDGREDLLLSGPAAIHAGLAGTTSRTFGPPLLQGDGMRLDLRPVPALSGARPASPGLALGAVGTLRRWLPEGGRLAPDGSAELPTDATWSTQGIALSSPLLQAMPRPAGDGTLYLAGPREEPGNRLSVVLVDFDAAEPDQRRQEMWLRVPDDLRYLGSSLAWVDGAPMLFVQASEPGLFEDIAILLYPLRSDRSQRGADPVRRIQTSTALWNRLATVVRDLDGDGNDDLVLVQPKGRRGGELLVDAFDGRGGGRFASQARRTVIDGPFQGWEYGSDLTGDGRPDLVAADGGHLMVFSGTAPGSDGPLSRRATHRLALPELDDGSRSVTVTLGASGHLRSQWDSPLGSMSVRDLDGDGRAEILAAGNDRGRGRLRVFRLSTP